MTSGRDPTFTRSDETFTTFTDVHARSVVLGAAQPTAPTEVTSNAGNAGERCEHRERPQANLGPAGARAPFAIDDRLRERIPPLTADEFEQLEANLLANGCRDSLVVWAEAGFLLDGHHRLEICSRNGLGFKTVTVSLPSREAAEDWIDANQIGRRNLTPEQTRLLIGRRYNRTKGDHGGARRPSTQSEYLNDAAGRVTERLAAEHGVSPATVQRAGEFAEAVELLGVEQRVLAGELNRVVVDEDGRLHERRIATADIVDAAKRVHAGETPEAVVSELRTGKPHVAHNSGNQEWYTPQHILDAAREVLGRIDLDPASNTTAQQRVRARNYYTAEQDGLAQEWSGTTWLNPPFAIHLVEQFTSKLVAAVQSGAVSAAVLLVNNSTDTKWFQHACSAATRICLVRGRIKFEQPHGSTSSPLQGQCVLYFGAEPERFLQAFSKFGTVLRHESKLEEVRP